MKKFKRVNIITIGLIIISIALLITGITYAYFQLYIVGTDAGITGSSGTAFPQGSPVMMKSFSLSGVEVTLETLKDGYINATNLNLIESHEVTQKAQKGRFVVTNRDYDNSLLYSISFVDLNISENMLVSDFKWQIVKLGNSNIIASGTFEEASVQSFALLDDVYINPRTAHEYELRLWIEATEEDQSYLLNGTFSGKISISAQINNAPVIK